jgi:hypothetical protein
MGVTTIRSQLRTVRRRRGLRPHAVDGRLVWPAGTVASFESGRIDLTVGEVIVLLGTYGLSSFGELEEESRRLARTARTEQG